MSAAHTLVALRGFVCSGRRGTRESEIIITDTKHSYTFQFGDLKLLTEWTVILLYYGLLVLLVTRSLLIIDRNLEQHNTCCN